MNAWSIFGWGTSLAFRSIWRERFSVSLTKYRCSSLWRYHACSRSRCRASKNSSGLRLGAARNLDTTTLRGLLACSSSDQMTTVPSSEHDTSAGGRASNDLPKCGHGQEGVKYQGDQDGDSFIAKCLSSFGEMFFGSLTIFILALR